MATDQDTIRMLTEALQGLRASSKKPEIPAFDPKNIDLWVKRVDNAYRRANITDPRDKFAFLESKFAVDTDPCINAFIFGDGTADTWDAFTAYLLERYGRTKQQRAAVILDGVRREGRKPSEMFAHIHERIGDLTIDDLIEEMVVRELPTDVQRVIHDRSQGLSGSDTVKLADSFFDKDGKPIHKVAPASVNQVSNCPGLIDTTDDESEDVSALGARPKSRNRRFRPGQQSLKQNQPNPRDGQHNRQQADHRPKERPAFTPAFSNRSNDRPPPGQQSNLATPPVRNGRPTFICKFHQLYGDTARSCEAGCSQAHKRAPKGMAGRQT